MAAVGSWRPRVFAAVQRGYVSEVRVAEFSHMSVVSREFDEVVEDQREADIVCDFEVSHARVALHEPLPLEHHTTSGL